MPEPKDNFANSWWLLGRKDEDHAKDIKNSKKDAVEEETNNKMLLHRIFEAYVDGAMKIDENDDSPAVVVRKDSPALIEYMEGIKVENMKTISYKSLNEQSNHLANILIKKLGTHLRNIHNIIMIFLRSILVANCN